MRKMLWATVVGTVALGLIGGGCDKDKQSQRQTVHVIGSTSVQPFAEVLGQEYDKLHPNCEVTVDGGGSAAGLKAVETGLADIGSCSRTLTPEEAGKFKEVVIARDGLAIVVNKDNPIDALTGQQIRDMFAGKIKNWREVGGKDANIQLVTREEGSGTREAFQHLIMGKDGKIVPEALNQESTGAIKALVKGNVQAISYMSLGQVGDTLKILKVDGKSATAANIVSGKYKLARPFLFVTKGPPNAAAQGFIDFVLSEEGQKKLENEGLIRAK